MFRKDLWILTLLAVALTGCRGDPVRLVVYHTNDVHGWILPREAFFHKPDPKRLIGGCAVLGGVLANGEPKDLLLDAGDWWQGTPEGGLTEGRAPVECFNMLGYDAAVVGNHEFDNGQERVRKLVQLAHFPVLGANVYDKKTGRRVPWLVPYVLKEVRGVKVGIFGLLTSSMKHLAFPRHIQGLRFRDEVEEARGILQELRAMGAQVVIALTHVGFEGKGERFRGDKHLASHVPGIDLIVGGHTHTPVDPPYRDPRNGTLVVQAGSTLSRVGKVVLVFDRRRGVVVHSEGRLVDLWLDRFGEAPEVKSTMARFEREVGRKLDIVISTASAPLPRARKEESPLGNWMTDCLRTQAAVDVAFQNSGGIRTHLPAGPVTLRHLYQVMPFDNYLVTLKLTGRQVRQVLEHGVSGDQGIMQVSGLRFTYSPRAPRGERVRKVAIGGRPLQGDRLYSVATNDFLVDGGDGYQVLSQGRSPKNSERLIREVLGSCARRHSPIEPPALGRIRKVPK